MFWIGGNSGSKPRGWNVTWIIRWQDRNTAFMHIAPWVIHGTSKWGWTISSWAAETGRKSESHWIIGGIEVLCGDSLGLVCRVRRTGLWRRNPGKHKCRADRWRQVGQEQRGARHRLFCLLRLLPSLPTPRQRSLGSSCPTPARLSLALHSWSSMVSPLRMNTFCSESSFISSVCS